jgi:hypothetical protein
VKVTPSTQTPPSTREPLADAIVTLAGTPDDMPGINGFLRRIAELAVTRIAGIDYAAICSRPDDGNSMVAVRKVTLDAFTASRDDTTALADSAATSMTMSWPDFRHDAAEMGLLVVSAPLFCGSGTATATLDLYSRDDTTMEPLTAGIRAVYDDDLPLPADGSDLTRLSAGTEELLTGLAEALSVRASIQLALTILQKTHPSENAYERLRLTAADENVSFVTAAQLLIAQGMFPTGSR